MRPRQCERKADAERRPPPVEAWPAAAAAADDDVDDADDVLVGGERHGEPRAKRMATTLSDDISRGISEYFIFVADAVIVRPTCDETRPEDLPMKIKSTSQEKLGKTR